MKLSKDVKNANHWWVEECERVIQEKSEARRKCLIKKNKNKRGHVSTKKK